MLRLAALVLLGGGLLLAGCGDDDASSGGQGDADFCSDLVCTAGETCSSCPEDCGSCEQTCGDGDCSGTEDCDACSADCGQCDASYVYVAPDGDDAGDGSKDAPWQTIQHAIDSVPDGGTVRVRAGTYNENLVLTNTGTAEAYLTLSNYPNETVVVNGQSGYALRADWTEGKSYWIIQGITFRTRSVDTSTLLLSSANWGGTVTDHWIVRNNRILGGGIIVRGNNHLVENNYIDGLHQNKSTSEYKAGILETFGGGSEPAEQASFTHHNTYRNNLIRGFERSGIWSMGYTHDCVFEGNTISDIYGEGGSGQCIDLDGAGSVEWRHVVRGNHVSGCGSEGIQLENTFDSLVENNTFADAMRCITVINYTDGVGCSIGGEENQYGDTNGDGSCQDEVANNIVRQNVLIHCRETAMANWGMDGVHYLNNSVYGNPSWNFAQNDSHDFEHTDVRCNINSLWLPDWALMTVEHNIDPENAMYTDPDSGNLSLLFGSPAIDGCVDPSEVQNSVSTALTTDFVGNPRQQGAAMDIGAYEHQE